MEVPGDAALLRIFIGANDVWGDRPLADALVYKAQEMGVAGATALRGILGYGRKTSPSPTDLLLSRDLPIVVELVDSRDKIDAYLAAVGPMIRAGLVTIQTIQVLRYGAAETGQA
jgi:uncharacterized protein